MLIKTSPGLTKVAYNAVRVSPTIRSVDMITGPYDLLVSIEGQSAEELLQSIMRDIRPTAGVQDTMTCLVVPVDEEGG